MRTVQQWAGATASNSPVWVWALLNPNGIGIERWWITEKDGTTFIPADTTEVTYQSLIGLVQVPKSVIDAIDKEAIDGE